MRIFSRAILFIICALSAVNARSQELTFESMNHNFGIIAEDGGDVTHTFEFKNSGQQPVVIVTASSSCGCTTPEYSRQPIAAGSSSSIVVTFDPMGRPGKFSKTIQFYVAPNNQQYVLTITGDVTPRKKSTEESYPFDMGEGLRLSANYYPLSLIEQGKRVETIVPYINTSKRSVKVELRAQHSSGKLEIKQSFEAAAESTGSFTIAYDMAKDRGYYGPLSDRYTIVVNGKESKYPLMVKAHAVDSFTDDERSAPAICNLSDRVFRLGSIKRGAQSEKITFIVENSGVADLVVRDVTLDEGVRCTIKGGITLAPSEQQQFELWVDSKGMDYGTFSRYATLTVNDPDTPMLHLRLIGTVEEKK